MPRNAMLHAALALALALAAGPAMAQSNPITGQGAGQVHGQSWNMRQDLHSSPGPGPQANRTQQLRQRSAQARRQQPGGLGRPVAQPRRPAAPTAAPPARPGAGQPGFEARLAEERRRQAAAEERAARAFPGVR